MHGAGRITRRRQQQAALPALASAALLACVVLAGSAVSATPQAKLGAKAFVVQIEGLRFDPATLTVSSGDRIVWVNKDLFPHTVTADANAFDSRDLAPDSSWAYVTRIPGAYPYGCAYHPNMKGKLIVRAQHTEAPAHDEP
jgi:plastocyanin